MRETIKGGMRGKAENENEGGKGKDRRSQFDSEVSITYTTLQSKKVICQKLCSPAVAFMCPRMNINSPTSICNPKIFQARSRSP